MAELTTTLGSEGEARATRAQAASAPAEAAPATAPRSTFREYGEALVVAIILALFIRTFLFQAFKIPSGSMLPTLQIGDHILVNKVVHSHPLADLGLNLLPRRGPERGDVVVFKFPRDLNRDFIKRVVGLPGDHVVVQGETVVINGQRIDESYAHYEQLIRGVSPRRSGDFLVPPGHYLVLGDNRDNSQDSRYWGFLPRDLVKGKAFLIYWSWDSAASRVRFDRLFRLLR